MASTSESCVSDELEEAIKNWNPMEEDFTDWKLNTYEDYSPGANLRKQQMAMLKNELINYKLYVGNVPVQLQRSGLLNIFSKAGVVREVVRRFSMRTSKCYAILEFIHIKECYEAIKLFHQKPPHFFHVKFADIDNRSTRDGNTEETEVAVQSNRPEIPVSFLPSAVTSALVTFCRDPQEVWLQLETNKNMFSEIFTLISEAKRETCQIIDEGDYCLAPCEGFWHRAVVEGMILPNVWVLFVDFGNRAKLDISEIKILPANLYSQPRQAIRVGLAGLHCDVEAWTPADGDKLQNLLTDEEVFWTIEDTGKDLRGIPQVRIRGEKGVINEKLPAIFPVLELNLEQYMAQNIHNTGPTRYAVPALPKRCTPVWYYSLPTVELALEDYSVVLVQAKRPPFLSVQLLGPQTKQNLELLLNDMIPCQFSPPLARIPQMDEVLGACFVEHQWCRVQVRSVDFETRVAFVVCVDYSRERKFKFDELRELPEKAAKRPICLHHVKLHGVPDYFGNFAPAKELLNCYLDQMHEMKVKMDGAIPVVRMIHMETKVNLNKELLRYIPDQGSSVSRDPATVQRRQFMYEESVMSVPAKEGETLELLVLEVGGATWLMMALSDADILSRFADLNDEINAAFPNREAEKPYMPIQGELVLAYSPQSNAWIRAACMCASNDRPHEALMISADVGILENVPTKCIRPMEERFMSVPMLATLCALKGYETKQDERVDKALKELLPIHNTVQATIVGQIDGALLLDIPSVIEQLTKMGFD